MVLDPWRIVADTEIEAVDIAAFFLIGEIKIRAAVLQQLFAEGRLVIFKCIGPQVKTYIVKGIGRVIDILQLQETVQAVLFVVQTYVDGIMYFLLPVR